MTEKREKVIRTIRKEEKEMFDDVGIVEDLKTKGIIRPSARMPIDYNELKAKERAKTKEDKEEKAQEILKKTIEYCNKNGKKTTLKFDGKTTVKDYMGTLKEEQLREIYACLEFTHNPLCLECGRSYDEGTSECIPCDNKTLSRGIRSIPDHKGMNYIIRMLEFYIEGFTEELEIEKIRKQIIAPKLPIEVKTVLVERMNTLRVHLNERLERAKVRKDTKDKSPFQCVCGKICKNAGGLGSHQNHCEEYQKTIKEE